MPEEDPHPALSKTKFARSKRLREVCDRAERVYWPFPYHGLSPVRLNRCSGRTSVRATVLNIAIADERCHDATAAGEKRGVHDHGQNARAPQIRLLGVAADLVTRCAGERSVADLIAGKKEEL